MVYADKAYDALSVEKAIEAKGGTSKLMRKGHRWLPAERLEAHNRPARGQSGRELKKSSGPGNAAIISAPCDGSGLPRQNYKSISPSSLTTSNTVGACKEPERIGDIARSTANSPPLEPICQTRHGAAVLPLNRRSAKRSDPKPPSQSCHTLKTVLSNKKAPPRQVSFQVKHFGQERPAGNGPGLCESALRLQA